MKTNICRVLVILKKKMFTPKSFYHVYFWDKNVSEDLIKILNCMVKYLLTREVIVIRH